MRAEATAKQQGHDAHRTRRAAHAVEGGEGGEGGGQGRGGGAHQDLVWRKEAVTRLLQVHRNRILNENAFKLKKIW